MKFELNSQFKPAGDQLKAIKKITESIKSGNEYQTLLGVTGSGKTFTVANVIQKIQKPTLIIAHNKTLAAQLCQEFRNFFPKNAVEYFVSYYDYYQPEAYLPNSDTYIEKDADINDEVEKLRHAATSSLLSRKDVIVVATVSCIYGLGSPEEYKKRFIDVHVGHELKRNDFIENLVNIFYERNNTLQRGSFRVVGEVIEVVPVDRDEIYRIEIENNKVKQITIFDRVNRNELKKPKRLLIYPAKHFVMAEDLKEKAFKQIRSELKQRVDEFLKEGKVVEAERLERRTSYDLEMIDEIGYCKGIENYSYYLSGRKKGDPPYTLIDFFGNKKDFLTIIDESHVTIPQIGAMYEGDRARKQSLVDYGFRLPSAKENRPLRFHEFEKKIGQTVMMSATPGKYEYVKCCPSQNRHSELDSESKNNGSSIANSTSTIRFKDDKCNIIEQIIRPTGLVDPQTIIRPIKGQIDDAIAEIKKESKKGNRILVTTLTKKMAEDLSKYLEEQNVKAKYLHSEVDTLDRVRILQDLRKGKFDCLVGVNLLREGLDLPEVSLVAIMDADKEGFLRSETSLIQTIGRAARHVSGRVILYADNMTGSMKRALDETERRRKIQLEYNKKHGITPKSIKKKLEQFVEDDQVASELTESIDIEKLPQLIREKEREMKRLAKELKFEEAALIRDEVGTLKKMGRI